MPTPRKRYFRVPDSVLREHWDDNLLATMIRLQAFLNTRWARDGIPHKQAGRATLRKQEVALITNRSRADVALKSLQRCANVATMTVERSGEVIEIDWPKFAEFQSYGAESRPKMGRKQSPSASRVPRPASRGKKKTPFTPQTGAPESLSNPDLVKVQHWLQDVMPAKAEEAERYAEECLDHHRARGNQHADWSATVIAWIRKSESWRREREGEPPLRSRAESVRLRREVERRREQMELA